MDRDFLSYVKPYQLRKRPHKLFGSIFKRACWEPFLNLQKNTHSRGPLSGKRIIRLLVILATSFFKKNSKNFNHPNPSKQPQNQAFSDPPRLVQGGRILQPKHRRSTTFWNYFSNRFFNRVLVVFSNFIQLWKKQPHPSRKSKSSNQ